MRLGGWLMMLTGMILFLTILGINTGLDSIVNFLGLTSTGINFVDSSFYVALLAAIGLLAGAGVVIGTIGRSVDPRFFIAPFVVTVAGFFIKTFVSIIKLVAAYEQNWMTFIIVIIFGTLAVGFSMACADYVSGG